MLAAVYTAFQPQANAETIVIGSVILLGVVMIIFTYFGGMEAVIWVEVVQLGIYLLGAVMAGVVLVSCDQRRLERGDFARRAVSEVQLYRLRNQTDYLRVYARRLPSGVVQFHFAD